MNLHGWDVVFAADISLVNAALARGSSALATTFAFTTEGVETSGTFGVWSIDSGGSGDLLMLRLEIASGQLTGSAVGAVDLGGMAVLLEVPLKWVPAEPGSEQTNLQFDFTDSGTGGNGRGVSSSRVCVPAGKSLTPVQQDALGEAIAECLTANAGKVSFVLATVIPSASANAAWLQPVASGYTYLNPSSGPASLLVLGSTSRRDVSALPTTVDSPIVPGGANAAVAVSPALFMRHVFMPALAGGFHAPLTSFSTGDDAVVKNRLPVPMAPIKVEVQSFSPVITSCSAVIADDHVAITLAGTCDLEPGATMTFNASSRIGATLDAHTGQLRFSVVGTPKFDHNITESVVYWFLGILTKLLIDELVEAIGSSICSGLQSAVSGMHMETAVAGLVRWSGSPFVAAEAGLAGTLYFRGSVAAGSS